MVYILIFVFRFQNATLRQKTVSVYTVDSDACKSLCMALPYDFGNS